MIFWFGDPRRFDGCLHKGQADRDQNTVFFYGFNECYKALRHPNLASDHHQLVGAMEIDDSEIIEYKNRTLLGAHDRKDRIDHRKRFAALLSQPYLDSLRSSFQTHAARLIESLTFDEDVDLVAEFCRPLLSKFYCEIFGLDESQWPAIYAASDGAHLIFDRKLEDRPLVEQSFERLFFDIRAQISKRIAGHSRPEMVGIKFVNSELAGRSLQEKCDFASMMLEASVANTAHQLGLIIVSILENEWAWTYLRNNRDCLDRFIREGIRVRSRSGRLVRKCMRDVVISDIEIWAGDLVNIDIWSAHRDALVFPQPHKFDPFRSQMVPLLTFGGGLYQCLGAALALEISTIAFNALLDSSLEGKLSDADITTSSYSAACNSVLAS